MAPRSPHLLGRHGRSSPTSAQPSAPTRFVPHVTFILDEGVKKSIEVARLIREEQEQIRADAAARAAADGTEPETPPGAADAAPGTPEPAERPDAADGPAGTAG